MQVQRDNRYLFHANAVALGGQIVHPFRELIESQGSAVLPITGGYGTARVENFRYRDIVSFGSATSTVTGIDRGNNLVETLATVTVEGLNVGGVVTAEAVTARLVSRVDRTIDRREIIPIGSAFHNLKIAGFRIAPEPREIFLKHWTIDGMRKACHDPALVKAFANFKPSIDREPRILSCLFDLPPPPPGLDRMEECGIRVPGFGTVFVGEFFIAPFSRQLTMLRIELGCPVTGTVTINVVEPNGSPY